MSRNSAASLVVKDVDKIIRSIDEKVSAKERIAPWRQVWSEKTSGDESAFFSSRCGEWQKEWSDFVNRKLENLRTQTKLLIAKCGVDDIAVGELREEMNVFATHAFAVKENARLMSAAAGEMLYYNDLREMKANLRTRFSTLCV